MRPAALLPESGAIKLPQRAHVGRIAAKMRDAREPDVAAPEDEDVSL